LKYSFCTQLAARKGRTNHLPPTSFTSASVVSVQTTKAYIVFWSKEKFLSLPDIEYEMSKLLKFNRSLQILLKPG
jgi:hypothetical protein